MRTKLYRAVFKKSALTSAVVDGEEEDTVKSNKFWVVVLGAVLLISAIIAITLQKGTANEAYIYLDGELIDILNLSDITTPYSFAVECENGINMIAVENGRIRVIEADCPDGTCVRQGWISGGTKPIICLPHRLVIELKNAAPPTIDAIAK